MVSAALGLNPPAFGFSCFSYLLFPVKKAGENNTLWSYRTSDSDLVWETSDSCVEKQRFIKRATATIYHVQTLVCFSVFPGQTLDLEKNKGKKTAFNFPAASAWNILQYTHTNCCYCGHVPNILWFVSRSSVCVFLALWTRKKQTLKINSNNRQANVGLNNNWKRFRVNVDRF